MVVIYHVLTLRMMLFISKAVCAVVVCCVFSLHVSGQVIGKDSLREAQIQYAVDDNQVEFFATTPPLRQIQGAPTAFYSFYWEFGDGEYSFDPRPKHQYKKEGEFKAQLWTTNNYDDGKPPPSRPKKVPIKQVTYPANPNKSKSITSNDELRLQNNRAPSPDEEMVVIVSYQNQSEQLSSGKLYVFFNEKRFKSDNFSLEEVRTHHGERESAENFDVASQFSLNNSDLLASVSPHALTELRYYYPDVTDNDLSLILAEAKDQFRDAHVLEFSDMAPGEERNIFYSLKTTPEMIKDTSATVRIRSVYVPKNTAKPKVKDLEMEIVTSHDPNTMSISETRINYRGIEDKPLHFKVRFQNNGEGPARSIMIKVDVPQLYNKSSLEVLDTYPPCPICPNKSVTYSCLDTLVSKGQIVFHFKNIYLPGSNQKNVEEWDSTKGFVKYSMKFNDHVPKKQTISRAAIIFDKNAPVLTNRATTRFIPGKSFGARAGYSYYPSLSKSQNFFAGVTLSPYKAYRGYWQVELNIDRHTYSDRFTFQRADNIGGPSQGIYIVDRAEDYNAAGIELVPISYRYNLNRVLGIGFGAQVRTFLSQKIKAVSVNQYYLYNVNLIRFEQNDYTSTETSNDRFNELNVGLFSDILIGSARIGPAFGVRYIYNYIYYKDQPHNVVQFYGQWKF